MSSPHTNRLATEASPYLLQHAANPVDWWPWCPEALAEAKRRDVPILLSIGYSACHWCHVMERESFEDRDVAALMNERFVNIKVDREERPDLDQIYQLVVQLLGRNGGWPLTVFLTPDQEPFFGGTYFPPVDRHGMAGFPRVLVALSDAYRTERGEVVAQAKELSRAIGEAASGGVANAGEVKLGPDLLEHASRLLLRRFDTVHGGFGSAPKFPSTMPLEVLLRRGEIEKHGPSRDAFRMTLEQMHDGGLWDQLGGGFHRYSTDERWLVPHFEKMLYDNALLLRSYAEAAVVFAGPRFRGVAEGIAGWLAREMTSERGGYFASQDADSEGREGAFFVWDEAEVRAACGEDRLAADVTIATYGVSVEGNFSDHGEPTGKTVLHLARPVPAVAARAGLSLADTEAALARGRAALVAARERRPRPFRDEKILTSWNGLMIGAMAFTGGALASPSILASARRAMDDVVRRLVRRESGGVRVARLAKGELVKGEGFLDDHAYLACAALELYEVTGDPAHATLARELCDAMLARFHEEGRGFFFTPKDGEAILARPSDVFDNAVPSATSMACRALAKVGTLSGGPYAAVAEAELTRLAAAALATPAAFGQIVCELDRMVRGAVDVVLVGPRDDARTQALARTVLGRYLPNRTVAWIDPASKASVDAASSLAEGKTPGPDGVPVAYVCRGRTCSLPVTDPQALAELLSPA